MASAVVVFLLKKNCTCPCEEPSSFPLFNTPLTAFELQNFSSLLHCPEFDSRLVNPEDRDGDEKNNLENKNFH